MLAPDDINVNQWVVVLEYVDENQGYSDGYDLFARNANSSSHPVTPGVPVQVRAISLPFVAVGDGSHVHVLDTRNAKLSLAHKKFVEVMSHRPPRAIRSNSAWINPFASWGAGVSDWPHDYRALVEDKKPEPKVDPKESAKGRCPACGEIMVKFKREMSVHWGLRCRQCGFEGGEGNTAT